MSRQFDNLLKRHDLEAVTMPASAMTAFETRTKGFLDVAWEKFGSSPENLAKVFRQYGMDCYTQGVLDGAKVSADNAEISLLVRGSPIELQPGGQG